MSKLKWENIAILVVDDNTFMRNLIVATLRDLAMVFTGIRHFRH